MQPGQAYKFAIRTRQGQWLDKADPFARRAECPPATGSVVHEHVPFDWHDAPWMAQRAAKTALDAPISVYEVHLGSWRRAADGAMLGYRDAAARLVEYVQRMGFTHVELLPVTEHPFYGSWGYQTTGYFAPTARYGTPQDFKYLVDTLHQAGIGVILDWVPSHFPTDAHGLAQLRRHAPVRARRPAPGLPPGLELVDLQLRPQRGALVPAVERAVLARRVPHRRPARRCRGVDAVPRLLRARTGEWIPNRYGGRENLEAISFLRLLNEAVYRDHPGVQTIAEESTAWPMVSRPTYLGGLGFGMKWNMGWMHDTLEYMHEDPVHRRWHHGELTFSLVYAFNENFMLPLSHDEVVHGKGSLIDKMPGDDWQQVRQPAPAVRPHVGPPGQEAAVHGRRVRPAARVEPRPRSSTGTCSTTRPMPACSAGSRT